MFSTGQKVACIDDKFEPWVFDLYRSLPKKDKIYTVRALRSGRSNPRFEVNDDAEIKMTGAEFDILVLLEELKNPDDPHSSVKQELGFRSERFAPLIEDHEEAHAYEKLDVGGGKKRKTVELVPAGV
jgi:hypothetical protein